MRSITVIMPAFNEEGNIGATLDEIVPLIAENFEDFEVLVFNDCSADKTGAIADAWSAKDPRVKVVHNPVNKGLGYNYRKGVEMASKDYVIMIPGDNEITGDSFREMFGVLGQKDIVVPYTTNVYIRPLARQILSKTYTLIINFLFGLNVRYYNGTVIHKRSIIQPFRIQTDSFSYQTEALVKLIKSGKTYIETGMVLKPRGFGESKALRLKNVARVFKSIAKLFFDVHFCRSQAQ